MALTPSAMVPLGTPLPEVTLPSAQGAPHRLHDLLDGRAGLLVLFLSNHCPYVKHVAPALRPLADALDALGVAAVGIHPNDAQAYPADAPAEVARVAAIYGFPQLVDATQAAAHAFRAACTPDVFLYDASGLLVYRGQLDASRPGRGDPTGADVLAAARGLAAGAPPVSPQHPATGCNIKWKPGNAPGGSGLLVGH